MIVDRSGAVLAENKINFTLYLVRENVENLEKTIQRASFFSGKSVAAIRQIIDKYKKYATFYRIPDQKQPAAGHGHFHPEPAGRIS